MGDDAPPMGGVATASRPALLDAGLWLRPATWPHWVSVLARHGWIALALAFSVATAGRLWDLTAGAGSRIQALYRWIPDIAQFSGLGESVLRGDLGGAYADPFNQAGPAQIIGDGLLHRLLAVLPGAAGAAVLMTLVASVPLLVGGSVAASLIRRLPDSSTLVLAAPWLTVAVLGLIGADEETPLIVADASDPASLDKMAASTKVVLTTVGPYQLYGNGLVAACVRAGLAVRGAHAGIPASAERTGRGARDRGRAGAASVANNFMDLLLNMRGSVKHAAV